MERSFARSTRYGFDRARWRGLWRVAIQEYVVCALQNIMTLGEVRTEAHEGATHAPDPYKGYAAHDNQERPARLCPIIALMG